jgi:hypothetical protein
MTQEEFLNAVFDHWETYEDTIDPDWRLTALSRLLAAEVVANIQPAGYPDVLTAFASATLTAIATYHLLPDEGDPIH